MKIKQAKTIVSFRYGAIYLNIKRENLDMSSQITTPVMAFLNRLTANGYTVCEELLHALCAVSPRSLSFIARVIYQLTYVKLNWAPLVKSWNIPVKVSLADYLLTIVANYRNDNINGCTLPCGHFIPEGTFHLERYNGCPFCGTPFLTSGSAYEGQGSGLKELRLFTDEDVQQIFNSLLTSATPLDYSQKDSLQKLLMMYDVPKDINIEMKETKMLVVKALIEKDNCEETGRLLNTPTDILRYLWYEKTGLTQIIEPKTLIAHSRKLLFHMFRIIPKTKKQAIEEIRRKLKLKYDRKTCQMVATWMNSLPMSARLAAEMMNPKRSMWVRFIRALRLGEYSRQYGYEHLAEILDVFYKKEYKTWQNELNKALADKDLQVAFDMLKQRPGLFARSLFATMLHLGTEPTMRAFSEIADKFPARLLLSLINTANLNFDPNNKRMIRTILGIPQVIQPNRQLSSCSDDERKRMVDAVRSIYKASMIRRFKAVATDSKTIYIAPELFNIPVSVGDRTTTIQDSSCALMGTRFAVEGDSVRLFMHWGKGLPAQDLDMDLSCRIAYEDGDVKECAFYCLDVRGAKHSGDIRSIPDMVGTAEYIELELPTLISDKAKYVIFTCNAYSCGALSPNLIVGWMNSANHMKISEENGVAYDPSCVQHMVRISEENLNKGLVFGVLNVRKKEIVWLEMPFTSQTIKGCDTVSVEALLKRLEEKISIGELLKIKAEAQNLTFVDEAEKADEAYTHEWIINTAQLGALMNI